MTHRAIQIVDLGFGDSGKGTIVDYLARRYNADLIVRFNGGPQAGHNVVLPDGRHHTFAQFGSGTFLSGLRTLLSRFMLIEPYALLNEAAHLASIHVADALSRTLIDERCLIITPPQQIANRIRERSRGDNAHGTCGMGIGECVADSLQKCELSLRASDLTNRPATRQKLRLILDYKRTALAPFRFFATEDERRVLDDPAWIETALDVYAGVAARAQIISAERANHYLRQARSVIFEAAQGVLLDERYGFAPHTTWSKTTFTNADALLDDVRCDAERQRVGVMRTYLTRHGAGPFACFSENLQATLIEPHNLDRGWQGGFRRGELDLVLLRYAIEACGGVDGLAITHLDRLHLLPATACDSYVIDRLPCNRLPLHRDPAQIVALGQQVAAAQRGHCELPVHDEWQFITALELMLKTPVLFKSRGSTFCEKE